MKICKFCGKSIWDVCYVNHIKQYHKNRGTKMKNLIFWIVVAMFVFIILSILGCATPGTPILDKIPTSAWESTMGVVAKTNWFGTFCLLTFFGGIVAIGLDQRKIGSAVVIAAISTLCLGLAINRFPTWMAIIGFTSSMIAVGYSILIKKKALVEIVRGVQNFRNGPDGLYLPDVGIDKDLNAAQSKSTKKIVKKIKEKNNVGNRSENRAT